MPVKVVTNTFKNETIDDEIKKIAKQSDRVKVAVAFFTDGDWVSNLLTSGKDVSLTVSLRFPTSYTALKSLMQKIPLYFHGDNFHSKIFLFYQDTQPVAAVVGSSNLSSAGMRNSIETNVILRDKKVLSNLEEQLKFIEESAKPLSHEDLENYKIEYRRNREIAKKKRKSSATKHGYEYLEFCKVIDKFFNRIWRILDGVFPHIPSYLVLDQFWQWIKEVAEKEKRLSDPIDSLFKDFLANEEFQDRIEEIWERSQSLSEQLSEKNLSSSSLKKSDLVDLYTSLHSGNSRFHKEKTFKENSIQHVRDALNFLLHNDEISLQERISMCSGSTYDPSKYPYKLKGFGKANVTELIGWVHPQDYPIQNGKAEFALIALGFLKAKK